LKEDVMLRKRLAVSVTIVALLLSSAACAQVEVRHPFEFGVAENFKMRVTFKNMTPAPSPDSQTEAEYKILLDGSSMQIGPYRFNVPGEIQRFATDNQAMQDSAHTLSRFGGSLFGNMEVYVEVVDDAGNVTAVPITHPLAAFAN
jgi:hypothetical protein